jgi:hypothetical protein
MYDNELTFKFNPSSIEFEDIPKLEAFITYLQSLILICRKEEERKENERKMRKPRVTRVKKNKVPPKEVEEGDEEEL